LAGRDALVADTDERGQELAALALQARLEIPVDASPEFAALFLALDDQPYGNALHAAGAQPRLHFLPEDRRERVPVEAIDGAAAFLRANEVLVHLGRVVERILDGVFSDLMKDDAADRNLWTKHLRKMPADGLAFAVRVGGEQKLGGFLRCRLEKRYLLLLVAR